MEIVIDIPERLWTKQLTADDYIEIVNAVANGTPLPKGHGRLIDADELYTIFNELCDDYNIDNLSFISDMNMNFDLAPTIIEAEGE